MMNIEENQDKETQFSAQTKQLIGLSIEMVRSNKGAYIMPEHILLAIIRQGNNMALDVLTHLDIKTELLETKLTEGSHHWERSSQEAELPPHVTDPALGRESTALLKLSSLEALHLRSLIIEPEHLLLAILQMTDALACILLNDLGVSYDLVFRILAKKTGFRGAFERHEEMDEEAEDNAAHYDEERHKKTTGTKHRRTKQTDSDTPMIDNYGMDLTMAATQGKLDPVVGREKEITRIAQILTRRKKNNPILIGEPGVGKSAIVEGLALRISRKEVARALLSKRIVALDMAAIVAGTKYRGQFEERIKNIIDELENNPDVIVFIDEIHTIVGAGSSPGTMDAANLLKPALARGQVQCIGATTTDEYRKTIEKDGALERRFQKVLVAATTAEETLQILHNIRDKYEDHHHVNYTDEALQACVTLAERYITDRSFPDKAIDVLDEAGARTHLLQVNVPQAILDQEANIARMTTQKEEAAQQQDFERAADLRDKIITEENVLEQLRQEWIATQDKHRTNITREEVEQVVSMISGVPVTKMVMSESVKLKGMRQALQQVVIAQEEPITKLVKAITRSRIGLKDPNRPIGSFMFLGPTGVGKTHLVKALAEFMFGSAEALIRVDMSEYMEKYSVSRLVGAPPGYVGYEEGGQLTERVRRRPYSIILLDEIEKAHSDVFNILLQVLDEGRLTDSNGATVDFKNTVIIMTSNTGSRQLKDFGQGVGFNKKTGTEPDANLTQQVIQKALQKQFAPEFLNRMDEIITFNPLTLNAIEHIAELEVEKLKKRMLGMGYTLHVEPQAMAFLAQKGFDPQYGARPLKRALQTYLEDRIAEAIMLDSLPQATQVYAHLNHEGTDIEVTGRMVSTAQKEIT